MYSDSKIMAIDQYLRKISRFENDLPDTSIDHSYVKHWSTHADSDRTRPVRMLFMSALQKPQSAYV